MTELWIVGKAAADLGDKAWEFQGVFDNEEAAVRACRSDEYFVGPAILNESLPDDREEWLEAYYPTLETSPRKEK